MDPPIKGADGNVYRLRAKKDGKSTIYFLEKESDTLGPDELPFNSQK